MMTKSDFIDWKNHPVTQEAMDAISTAAVDMVSRMVQSDEPDLLKIQYQKGFIRGIQEFMEWEPDFED